LRAGCLIMLRCLYIRCGWFLTLWQPTHQLRLTCQCLSVRAQRVALFEGALTVEFAPSACKLALELVDGSASGKRRLEVAWKCITCLRALTPVRAVLRGSQCCSRHEITSKCVCATG